MTQRHNSLINHRTLLILQFVFFSIGIIQFCLVQRSVTDFKYNQIQKNMNRIGKSISYFCSASYDKLARIGKISNTIEILLKQAETLKLIEDFVRNNDFYISTFDLSEAEPLLILSTSLKCWISEFRRRRLIISTEKVC